MKLRYLFGASAVAVAVLTGSIIPTMAAALAASVTAQPGATPMPTALPQKPAPSQTNSVSITATVSHEPASTPLPIIPAYGTGKNGYFIAMPSDRGGMRETGSIGEMLMRALKNRGEVVKRADQASLQETVPYIQRLLDVACNRKERPTPIRRNNACWIYTGPYRLKITDQEGTTLFEKPPADEGHATVMCPPVPF